MAAKQAVKPAIRNRDAAHRVNLAMDRGLSQLSRWLRAQAAHSVAILCDSNTRKHCLPYLLQECHSLQRAMVISVTPGERSKSLKNAEMIWKKLVDAGAGRDTILVNLGGGMICDLGGFAASVYKRGMKFVHVPTSLLAMADAAIGGKTAVNLLSVKNVIGSFRQPDAIFISTRFLDTLPPAEYREGYAEILKIATVADKTLWKEIVSGTRSMHHIVNRAAVLKQKIVSRDPFESGVRKVLNFGHSIGHAIESATMLSQRPFRHGEAVVAGMIIETQVAVNLGYLSERDGVLIGEAIERLFSPRSIARITTISLMKFIRQDKKNRGEKLMFSLPLKPGACRYDIPVSETEILRALSQYNARYQ
jgi:3-dehydroquinate synthase